jgi:hypothetical protein
MRPFRKRLFLLAAFVLGIAGYFYFRKDGPTSHRWVNRLQKDTAITISISGKGQYFFLEPIVCTVTMTNIGPANDSFDTEFRRKHQPYRVIVKDIKGTIIPPTAYANHLDKEAAEDVPNVISGSDVPVYYGKGQSRSKDLFVNQYVDFSSAFQNHWGMQAKPFDVQVEKNGAFSNVVRIRIKQEALVLNKDGVANSVRYD